MPTKTKRDPIREHELRALIIAEYRRGRPVKKLEKEFSHYTIDDSGGRCPEGMLNGWCMRM